MQGDGEGNTAPSVSGMLDQEGKTATHAVGPSGSSRAGRPAPLGQANARIPLPETPTLACATCSTNNQWTKEILEYTKTTKSTNFKQSNVLLIESSWSIGNSVAEDSMLYKMS